MRAIPDPYRLLGVPHEATLHEIKAAHRRLAKRYHPDAAEGDTGLFLAVQEAYLTLSDPLKRRDWDARHQPGPVRADGGPSSGMRAAAPRRGAARGTAAGSGTAAEGGREQAPRGRSGGGAGRRRRPDPWSTSGRDPTADSYTWTAQNVPWWEEGAQSPGRRPPGRRRPTADEAAARRDAGQGAAGSTGWRPRDGWGAEPGPNEEPPAGAPGRAAGGASARGKRAGAGASDPDAAGGSAAGPAATGPESTGQAPAGDFDVYSRSSGAAWSMASRIYFRRAAADLPRGAAEPFGHRWTSPDGGDERAAGAATRSRRPGPRSAGATAGAPAGEGTRSATGGPGPAPSPDPGSVPGAAPAVARPGVTTASAAFAAMRERLGGTREWPSVRDRVLYATLAWLPPLMLLAGSTPGAVSPLRTVLLGGLLALFALAPRLAYLAAVGGAAALVAGAGLLLGQALIGPVDSGALALAAPLALAVVYVGAALLAVRDWPMPRPWTVP